MRFWHESTGAFGAEAREQWGSPLAISPVPHSYDGSTFDIAALAHLGRQATYGTSGDAVPGQMLPASQRTGGSSLLTDVEELLAAGRPELAAERLIGAILSAGLAAALFRPASAPSHLAPANLAASSVLTRREREVARLIVTGCTNRQIAEELFIAQSTVERHVANILSKLGFSSRTQIAAWAVQSGLAAA